MADRCHDCDKPLADGAPFDTLSAKCRGGDCNGCDACRALCWRQWHGDVCQSAAVDWRARAIAAEAALADAGVLRGDDAARLLASLSQTCSREEADRRTAEAREYLARVTTHPADHARAVLDRETLGRVAYDAMFAEVRKADADATDEWETDADARTAFATAAEAVARHVARAVLDAIRAVPLDALLLASERDPESSSLTLAGAVRARLLAAGEAAAEGRR